MIGIQIYKISVWRKLISFFILVQMMFPLGSAIFFDDKAHVESKLASKIRTGSSITQRDPLCGISSSGSTRKKKCEEVFNSVDVQKVWSGITYDENKPDLPLKKCESCEIKKPPTLDSSKKITLKMFQCPFQQAGKSGVYFMSLGSKSEELFLFSGGSIKETIAWYSSDPFRGK